MKNWKRGNYILQYSFEYRSTYVLICFEQMLYHEITESSFQLVDVYMCLPACMCYPYLLMCGTGAQMMYNTT